MDEPVIPFDSAVGYALWQERNCMMCKKYENESQSEEEASCHIAFHLDMGAALGTIPRRIAKEIGATIYPSCHCKLNNHCKYKEEIDE